jgi:hypothetical protein
MVKNIVAASVLLAFAAASNAAITVSLGGNTDPAAFITLSAANVSGGILQTGGSIPQVATLPADTLTGGPDAVGTWLSSDTVGAGGGNATVSFAATNYLSFLWGTIDAYNTIVVNGTNYTYADFGLPADQASGAYVTFSSDATDISSVQFVSTGISMEVANFAVSAVPEPETYALMLGGLGLVGFMARRRKAA